MKKKKPESFVLFFLSQKENNGGVSADRHLPGVRGCGHLMARLRGQGIGHLGEALSRYSERVGKGLQFSQTTQCLTGKPLLAQDAVYCRVGGWETRWATEPRAGDGADQLGFNPTSLSQGSWALLPTGFSGVTWVGTQGGAGQGRGWREGRLGPRVLLSLISGPPTLFGSGGWTAGGTQEEGWACKDLMWVQGIKAFVTEQKGSTRC